MQVIIMCIPYKLVLFFYTTGIFSSIILKILQKKLIHKLQSYGHRQKVEKLNLLFRVNCIIYCCLKSSVNNAIVVNLCRKKDKVKCLPLFLACRSSSEDRSSHTGRHINKILFVQKQNSNSQHLEMHLLHCLWQVLET